MAVTVEDQILIKILWKKKICQFFKKQKLICHVQNKYLLNKIDQSEVAVL